MYIEGGFIVENGKPKVIVYTALFGNYDSVKEPLFIDENIDYILFTDNGGIQSDNWKTKILEIQNLSSRKMSLIPKILPHKFLPSHDISIYLDASFQLQTQHIHRMITDCLEGHEIALYKHHCRNCTYEEIEICKQIGFESPTIADRVRKKYLKECFPNNWGLFENGFILRKNTENINKLNKMWFIEYISGSERDQFSLMYCLWKLGITANSIKMGKDIYNNPYLKWYNHL
nr:glycosyltransferase domain-containing protein [Bacillus wiedmannii]